MKSRIVEEIVIVTMNLPGDYTRVLVDRSRGVGMADGGIYWEIPTGRIPVHLRLVGSRFRITKKVIEAEPGDSPEVIRQAISDSILDISAT
jgi:hypothetical protein